jgi:superfamily II DNA or RNA helicase
MSILVNINELNNQSRNMINNDLVIDISTINKFSRAQKVMMVFDSVNNKVILPYAYTISNLPLPKPPRANYYTMSNTEFNGVLREPQIEVKNEAVKHLNKNGSVMISCHTGFGKCLGENTLVMKHNGALVKVQDIKDGDVLMGDDGGKRNVLGVVSGYDTMYDIKLSNGDFFVVNSSHIISLKFANHKKIDREKRSVTYLEKTNQINKINNIKNINKNNHSNINNVVTILTVIFDSLDECKKYTETISDDNIIDITITDYLKLDKQVKSMLKMFKVPVKKFGFKEFFKSDNFNTIYDNGKFLNFKFSDVISYSIEQRRYLMAGIIDYRGIYRHFTNSYDLIIPIHKELEKVAYVARSIGLRVYIKNSITLNVSGDLSTIPNDLKLDIDPKISFENTSENVLDNSSENVLDNSLDTSNNTSNNTYVSDFLYTTDNVLLHNFSVHLSQETKYYGFTLDDNHRFLLGDFTVTHNTCTAINLATTIKLKTLILSHRIILIDQWVKAIEKFCPKSVVVSLDSKDINVKHECDFYVINPENICKFGKTYFSDVGCVIVDEAHLIMAESLSTSLKYVFPRYIIGLSATPFRIDGLHQLLDIYFGKERIVRKLFRKHIVYKIRTGFKPKIVKRNGSIVWDDILKSQANDEYRNSIILHIVKKHPKRVFLIIVKRIDQGKYLYNQLLNMNESVDTLLSTEQTYDENARILISTNIKCGTGFDHSKLDAMIIASDLYQFFEQYHGRVFRTESVIPLIFDLVDSNGMLEKHYLERERVYLSSGGEIKNYTDLPKSPYDTEEEYVKPTKRLLSKINLKD